MAATITDNRTIIDEADVTIGWTGTNSPSIYTTSPDPIESTGCLGVQVSTETVELYHSITSDNWSSGGTYYAWVQPNGTMDTTVNGGVQMVVGDGTNRVGYHVGGSDGSGFRHETGPVNWTCFVLDPANLPSNYTVWAGTEASLNWSAVTQVGVGYKTLSKALGGSENCFTDIIRWSDVGVGITVGGTSGTFSDLATLDRSTGNQQAYGVVRELGTGVYGIQTHIKFGDTGTASTSFSDSGVTIVFEDRGLSSNNYYRISLVGNATGTNTFSLSDSTIQVPSAASAKFDASATNFDTCSVTGCTLNGVDQGVVAKSGQTWTSDKFSGCGTITAAGADFTGSEVLGYEGTADTASLSWNVATDPDGYLDNMSFTKGTASTHAIEFGTSAPTSITLRDINFSGYNAANGNTDSTFYVARTTGTVTINVVGGSGNVTYKSAGATVSIVLNPVTTTITVKDINTGTVIQDARVYVEAADATGPYPYRESVTITSSGTTATVSHTSHGMATNDWVTIRGADQNEYNGAHQITVTDANTYTYTISGTPASPATGTITSTWALFNTTTDASGQVTDNRTFASDQPITGRIRKSSASPYYKSSPIAGTIDSANGFTSLIQLVPDE